MEQKWVKDNFIYLRAGKLFLKNVLVIPDNFKLVLTPPESQFAITISFIDEIYKLLGDVLVDSFKSRQKYYPAYFKTFERELLHWIGCFTETKNGF